VKEHKKKKKNREKERKDKKKQQERGENNYCGENWKTFVDHSFFSFSFNEQVPRLLLVLAGVDYDFVTPEDWPKLKASGKAGHFGQVIYLCQCSLTCPLLAPLTDTHSCFSSFSSWFSFICSFRKSVAFLSRQRRCLALSKSHNCSLPRPQAWIQWSK